MHPVLFELPDGTPVHSFGVFVALGFLLAAHLLWPRALRTYGDDPVGDPPRSAWVSLWILVGLLVGGRGAYALVEVLRELTGPGSSPVGARFLEAPWEIAYLWKGGLVMYGGFAGAVLFGVVGARRSGLALGTALDTGLTAGFFGQAIGRIGCLMIGDDHGSVVPATLSSLPFPIVLQVPPHEWLRENPDSLFPAELAGQALWATQTWMSLAALTLSALGFRWLRTRRYPGQVALRLGLAYAIMRSLIEVFRGDPVRGLWFGDLISTSQLLSIPLGIGCALALHRNSHRKEIP